MRYMLMLHADEVAGSQIPPDEMRGYMGQMAAYKEALAKAGAFIEAVPLMTTDTACTIRMEDGTLKVQDGPYPETREQLGGYYVIEAPDMEAARTWAARCPAATWGAIEVRPVRQFLPA